MSTKIYQTQDKIIVCLFQSNRYYLAYQTPPKYDICKAGAPLHQQQMINL